MSSNIIILKDGYMPKDIPSKGKTYILTSENEKYSIKDIMAVAKSDSQIIDTGHGSDLEYAFKLGQILAADPKSIIYTGDKKFSALVQTESPVRGKRAQTKAPKQEKAPDKEESVFDEAVRRTEQKKDAPKERSEEKTVQTSVQDKKSPAKVKEPKSKAVQKPKGEAVKVPGKKKAKEEHVFTAPKSTDFSKLTVKDVESTLKEGGFDTKYAPAVAEALKGATSVTADLLVRTKLSVTVQDKDTCFAIGELIKKTYC